MPYTPWDKDLGRHGELTKREGCGENRYVGVENFLEFYITINCEIKIVPRDSIMVSVRLDWTLEEFYAADGVDSFTDRMAAVLGVHASQIKVVAVYQGSVIVEYFVETLPDDEDPEKTLNQIELNFYEAVASGDLDLGAPLIDAMSNGRVVKTNYDGDHYEGKDGNIWDHLINDDDNNQTGGATNNDGESTTNPNDNTNTGGNTSDNTNDNTTNSDGSSNTNTDNGSNPTISKVTKTEIVVDEVPAMTDTVKYLIVFLAVISVALIFVIGYVAMRMCTTRRMKPMRLDRRASQPRQDVQYAGDDAKDIFSDKKSKRKINEADEG